MPTHFVEYKRLELSSGSVCCNHSCTSWELGLTVFKLSCLTSSELIWTEYESALAIAEVVQFKRSQLCSWRFSGRRNQRYLAIGFSVKSDKIALSACMALMYVFSSFFACNHKIIGYKTYTSFSHYRCNTDCDVKTSQLLWLAFNCFELQKICTMICDNF